MCVSSALSHLRTSQERTMEMYKFRSSYSKQLKTLKTLKFWAKMNKHPRSGGYLPL